MKPSKKFKVEQKKWYKKLKDEGFDDIEWTDHNTGYGHDTKYIKQPAYRAGMSYNESTEVYYSQCREFVTKAYFKANRQPVKLTFELYSEGIGYREISQRLKDSGHRYNSLLWISFRVNEVLADMKLFFKTPYLVEPEEPNEFYMSMTNPKVKFTHIQCRRKFVMF